MSNSNGAKADLLEVDFGREEVIEEWRMFKAEGVVYEVSNLGHVRRYLKPFECMGSKYLQINVPGRGNVFLHKLVTELFLGPKPEGLVTNHKDGNGLNPKLENLEYVTQSYNMLHASRTGLRKYGSGEKATRWKVSDATAQQIVDDYRAGGTSIAKLADKYGITKGCAKYIVASRKGLNRG